MNRGSSQGQGMNGSVPGSPSHTGGAGMGNRGGMRPPGFGPPGRGGPRGRFGPVEKPKNFRGTLRRLLRYLRPHSKGLTVVFLMATLSTVFTIFSPKLLGKITTSLYTAMVLKGKGVPGNTVDFTYIGKILLILAGLYLFSTGFSYLQQYIMAGVSQTLVYDMRKELNEKLNKLPLKYFDGRSHGEILSRVVNDMDNISSTLQQTLVQTLTSMVTLVGVIIMMLTLSPLLTLIVVLTLPLSFVITAIIVSRSQKYFLGQRRLIGVLNGHVEEAYTGHDIIKAFGKEQDSIAKFTDTNEQLYEAAHKSLFISGMIMPLMNFVGNIGYVLVCVVGGVLVTKRAIEVGDIQAFIQYARQFSQPITQAANISNIIQSTIASAERVFEVLDEEEEVDVAVPEPLPESPLGNVELRHVHFQYQEDKSLLQDVNIAVKSGQSIAIVGPTGAGKTTLVNLLMRFYDVNDGSITVDGVDVRSYTRHGLRSLFGMVLQDTWLFNGTIRENIAYGRMNATEKEIVSAAKAANAHHFIQTLPAGYDTIINQEASNISYGQKQLITIARAFLADAPILILDEATSGVDTRTEVQIQSAMQALMKGRTNFVIAHRLSTIRNADLILVMDHGRIVEQGTHDELLNQDGVYADLYNSQFTMPQVVNEN